MTYPGEQPPTVPGPPNPFWPPVQAVEPPRGKSRLPWLITAGAVGLILVVVLGIAVALGQGGSTPAKTPSAWDQEQAQAAKTESTPTAEAPAPAATPKVADFKLTPRITDKKCFGPAGCNIDFKIEMDYLGESLSENDTWEVTYEVAGVDDGPMIGTLELTGTTFTASEESVSTSSSKKKISIKVTSVDKVGI